LSEYKIGGLVPSSEPLSFTRMSAIIQSKKALKLTSAILMKAKKLSVKGKARKYKNPSRVFLSSFVICHHSEQWMPEMGDLENAVKRAAVLMLELFDKILNGKRREHFEAFMEAWHEYYLLFEEWKTKDTEHVLNYMFEHYMQLEKLWESVQGHPDVESHWKPQIEKQRAMIRDKVVKIAGKDALDRFGGTEPKVMVSTVTGESSKRIRHDSVNSSKYLTEDEQDTQPSPKPQTPKSPEVKLPDVLNEFGSFLTNERLAHELIVNPDFELTPQVNPLEQQIKVVMKKAFFDKIRESLEKSDYGWVPSIVSDIKGQLLSMLTAGGKISNEIRDAMDEELVHQQVTKAVFNAPNFVAFVVSKMLQLCAPIRDAAIRQIIVESDLVRQLEMILAMLEEMKLDLANYRLKSLRPHLMKQAVEYERSKFEKALKSHSISLEKTKKWLEESSKKTKDLHDSRNPDNVYHPENRVKYDAVYFDALLSIVFNNEKLANSSSVPETFSMDVERIASLQNEAQAITVVAALIMLTKNFIPEVRENVNALQQLKSSILVLMQDPTTTVEHLSLQLIAFAGDTLKNFNKTVSEKQITTLKQMVDKTMAFNDSVFLLLNRRISRGVQQHLVTGKFRKDSNNGLEYVEKEVESLSHRIFTLSKHNRDVYGPWYDQILNEIQ